MPKELTPPESEDLSITSLVKQITPRPTNPQRISFALVILGQILFVAAKIAPRFGMPGPKILIPSIGIAGFLITVAGMLTLFGGLLSDLVRRILNPAKEIAKDIDREAEREEKMLAKLVSHSPDELRKIQSRLEFELDLLSQRIAFLKVSGVIVAVLSVFSTRPLRWNDLFTWGPNYPIAVIVVGLLSLAVGGWYLFYNLEPLKKLNSVLQEAIRKNSHSYHLN